MLFAVTESFDSQQGMPEPCKAILYTVPSEGNSPAGQPLLASPARWGLLLVLLGCLSSVSPLFAARLASETRVPYPPSAKFNLIISDKPRDGERVTINPPIIAWSYAPTPTNSENPTTYQFQFQAAYEPTFTNPVVNVRTRVNGYNFLAPFTNHLYSSNVVFWRVLYIRTNSITLFPNSNLEVSPPFATPLTNYGAIRSFVIPPGTPAWDRSMLADTNYLATKAVHPRLLFNDGNRQSLSNWLVTNLTANVNPGWQINKQLAYRSITNSWWTMPDPTTAGPLGSGGQWIGGWPYDIARCAFVWQMTRDPRFLAEPTNICQRASDAAVWCITNTWESRDIVWAQSDGWIRSLPMMYDWLYHEFTTAQRSNVLFALEKMARFYTYGAGVFSSPVKPENINWYLDDPLASYTNGFQSATGDSTKHGSNHPGAWQSYSIYPALAAYGDGPFSAEYLKLILNLSMIRPHPQGTDENPNAGRGYVYDGIFNPPGIEGPIVASTLFPEVAFNRNPYFDGMADWYSRMLPPGFYEANEPFGDVGSEAGYRSVWATRQVGRDLGVFLNDGRWLMHHLSQSNFTATSGNEQFWDLPTEFHFPPPAPVTNAVLNRAFFKGGWVMGSSKPSNTPDSYTNGVGYVLAARGSGHTGSGHDSPVDLTFQFWAYGVPVTESGYGMLGASKASWLHYTPAFNGLGVFNHGSYPLVEAYSKIIAYTNGANFTYAAVDGRNAYPVFDVGVGGWVVDGAYAAMHSGGPARALTKAQRHLLFMRNKYWVIFDDYASQTHSTYSWIWQVPIHTRNLVVGTNTGSFSYTSTNGTKSITVMAQSFTAPENMALNDQRGWDAVKNPINGFSFKPVSTWSAVLDSLPAANAQQTFVVVGPRLSNGYGYEWTNTHTFNWTRNIGEANATNVYTGTTTKESLTNLVSAVMDRFKANPFVVEWITSSNVNLTPPVDTLYHEYGSAYSSVAVSYKALIVPRPAALWWNTAVPTNVWKTGWVIYPVKNGEAAPTIQRLDNLTVSVTSGTDTDVISFDPNTTFPATLVVDVNAIQPPAAPGPVGPRPGTPSRPFINQQ